MKVLFVVGALFAGLGCASAPTAPATVQVATRCGADESVRAGSCRTLDAGAELLDRAGKELSEFRPEEAVSLLALAEKGGPYRHADLVRLYERLGVARAYLDQQPAALAAFDRVLLLEPGHAISYTLSPKATFVFEQARKRAASRTPPEIRVTWPRDLEVRRPVPIEVEVLSDPAAFLRRARLGFRRKEGGAVRFADFALEPTGRFVRLVLPAVAPDATRGQALLLHLVAYDDRGNEVLLWGSAERPTEVPIPFEPETAWYERWWVWGIAGVVVAGVTGALVFAATDEPPDTVGGTFTVR